ncbi:MAG: helix-turn-helix domain-containing protein [Xenococcus sp. (in: cyanobacteria)]
MDKPNLTFKELREAKGYTQESLGQAVGVSRLAISRYELKQAEPKLGNFLKIARILEVSLAELALAMGYETEEESVQVCTEKLAYTPAKNEDLERESVQVFNDNPGYTPAKRRSKGKGTGFIEVSLAELALAMGYETEEESVQVCTEKLAYTPAKNEDLERESVQVFNDHPGYTPAKRRAKGKGTGFIEERLVKRGNKQYKQYWFHWQKSEPGKRRILAKSKYIPKRLVAKIIEKNHQKLPVREILQSLGV